MAIKRYKTNHHKVQEDGLISHPQLGEARFIPAMVVNSVYDNRLKELIKIHQDTPPGDTISYWSKPTSSIFKTKKLLLHIEFSQPMIYKFQIEFNLQENYSLIDAIMLAQATYLSYGNKGDKVSEMRKEMILVEIPEMGNILKLWNKTLDEVLRRKFKKMGVPKKMLIREIKHHKTEMRKILLMDKNTAPK